MDLLGLVILLILLAVVLPIWPYNQKWGYLPSGIVTILLLILIISLFMPSHI